ncbi:MAG: hypothetical protein PF442_11045 [Desulfobulbaceae bacterium]|jgi:hypothetical protein|nr:hypothetical protein [Desulfobulbaceae bacterium]
MNPFIKPAAFIKRDILLATSYPLQQAAQTVGIFIPTFHVSKLVDQLGTPALAP